MSSVDYLLHVRCLCLEELMLIEFMQMVPYFHSPLICYVMLSTKTLFHLVRSSVFWMGVYLHACRNEEETLLIMINFKLMLW